MFNSLVKKANRDYVEDGFRQTTDKIDTLDTNIVCIAQDFETFQSAINKLH